MNEHQPPVLEGLRVVELAGVLAGPAVGMFFAELGAEVVKVEPPGGDVTRRWKLPTEDPADPVSAYYACVNWGKRSIQLDLRQAADRALLHQLLARADVLITNLKAASLARFGLALETLSERYPQLIAAGISGYGPASERLGYDAVIQAEAGFMHLNGAADGPPLKMPVALMDLLAAHQAKEAILLGLWQRERSGCGQALHISLAASGLTALANQAASWLWSGHEPMRSGSAHPQVAPYGSTFRTADGEPLLLAVGSDAQFRALCKLLGASTLSDSAAYATNAARVRNREALEAALAQIVAEWDAAALLHKLQQAKVPAGLVKPVPDALAAPDVADLLLHHPSAMAQGLRTIAFSGPGVRTRTELVPPDRIDAGGDAIRQALRREAEY